VDIFTGTFGKALGGASGGYTSGRRAVVDLLRQRSRPYLFSNTVAPVIAAATLKAIELLSASTALRDRLEANTRFFREEVTRLGFDIRTGEHPIVPIMLGEARLAQEMASRLLDKGLYVIGFSYPVVPMDRARIRVQLSALHSRDDLEFAVAQFESLKGMVL
jgi:glycine C-acetyltransferase